MYTKEEVHNIISKEMWAYVSEYQKNFGKLSDDEIQNLFHFIKGISHIRDLFENERGE